MNKTHAFLRAARGLLLATCLIVVAIAGCGDDDKTPTGSSGGPTGPRRTISLQGALSDIQVQAGATTHMEFTLQVPPDFGVLDSAAIDVAGSLQHVAIATPVKARDLMAFALGQASVNVNVRVGTDPSTVCTSGMVYGPYSIFEGFWSDPTPGRIPIQGATVQQLNSTGVTICMDINSTIDGSCSIDEVEMDIYESECDDPVDFTGTWIGTYSCDGTCEGTFGDSIQLVVTQDGTTASYIDDAEFTYSGTVCGNVFRFERVGEDEIERGTLVLESPTTAVKRSTYRSTVMEYCFGDCIDSLTRVPIGK